MNAAFRIAFVSAAALTLGCSSVMDMDCFDGSCSPHEGIGGSGGGGETTGSTTDAASGAGGQGGELGEGGAGGAGGSGTGGEADTLCPTEWNCPVGMTCIDVLSLPFHDARDTSVEGSDMYNSYACSPSTNEQGPEIIYRVRIPHAGQLSGTITDGDGVDIDVQLLNDMTPESCIARDDITAVVAVDVGCMFVVADTWHGSADYPGAYAIDIALDPP